MSSSKKAFDKPPIDVASQAKLLARRALDMPDQARAEHYLKFIGYYRLSGYVRFFSDPADPKREVIRGGTSFDDVLALYIFDRKLRVLLMDAFERIEIAVKAVFSHEGAMSKGAFWLCEPKNFDHGKHPQLLEDIKEAVGDRDGKAQHVFISHFYKTYADAMPPSWMIAETLSFGLLSRLYKSAKGEIQSATARHFSIHREVMASWLHALAFGRNVCAHNCRVWNRTFTIKPKIPRHYSDQWPLDTQDKLYSLCCVIHHMMEVISDGTAWSDRLRSLINERGDLPLQSMGFPGDWENRAFWGFQPNL